MKKLFAIIFLSVATSLQAQTIPEAVIDSAITRDSEIFPTGEADAVCIVGSGPTFQVTLCSTIDVTDKTFKFKVPEYTVATLPASHELSIVTNGTNASDCTVGGGSTRVLCHWTGSAWASIGGGGTGTGSQHSIDGVNLTSNDPVDFQDSSTINFTNPAAGDIQAAVKDDSIATGHLADGATTYAKMQSVSAASRLLGRGSSSAGVPQEITLGSGLTMTSTTLSVTSTLANHDQLGELDDDDHSAIYPCFESGAGPPSAGAVNRTGCVYFDTTNSKFYAGYGVGGNYIDVGDQGDAINQLQVNGASAQTCTGSCVHNIASGGGITLSNAKVDQVITTTIKPPNKDVQVIPFDFATDTATGDGKFYFRVPASLNNWVLTGVQASVVTAGTTGTLNVDLARCAAAATGNLCSGTVVDMLSTNLTIDSGENDSATAAAAAVIDASNDDVTTGQIIRVDVDAVHTTAAKGLIVNLEFTAP
jgi:hypothetical protein